jgi:hypothetical protein
MTEHPHMPQILRTGAKRLPAGEILVTIRCERNTITMKEAEELWCSLDAALDGDGPQIVCEVVR